ncbi:MAG TPA: helix-hairpin-helix domain-containing protein, partial [Chryseosolibacter sp.]
RTWLANQPRRYTQDQQKLDSLIASSGSGSTRSSTISTKQIVAPFIFDPNTASIEQLRSLGFPRILATRIAAYRQKGGVFTARTDLLKIYGVDSTLYHQLYPYINLPAHSRFASKDVKPPKAGRKGLSEESGVKRKEPFDINTADTILLKSVYGIGSKLAIRIVKFRDALGGFVKPEQLNEVYGLDSSVVKRLLDVSFIKSGFVPVRININVAGEEQLSAHPYIRYKIARALISYRYQHGDFADASDIRKLSILGEQEVERLLPYVKVND